MAIDSTPDEHPITHYCGDTLTLEIGMPAGFADGFVWTGQIRANRETGTPVDAVFNMTPPAAPGEPGYAVLTAAESERLARENGTPILRKTAVGTRKVVAYTGEYDIQVAPPAPETDPVTTIIQGTISIELDVTQDG